jgi:hypothetical protein
MQDLDHAYREAFVDAWMNNTGVEPHEAGLLSAFLIGAAVTGGVAQGPELVEAAVANLFANA